MRSIALTLLLLTLVNPLASATHRPPGAEVGTLDAIGPDTIADQAARLDYDLDRIFRFVADEIQFEPYSGILRGASGTLAAGAGNSYDQALLLGALLDESLIPYRFAQGALDDAAAARLLDSAVIDETEARAFADRILVGELDAAIDPGIEIKRSAAQPPSVTLDEVDGTIAQAEARMTDTLRIIETALTDAGIEMPAPDTVLPAMETDQHVWVQATFGADWLDLDPSVSGSERGTPITAAAETLDALPDAARHQVEFEVFLERVRGGQLVTEPILAFSDYADRLAGIPITFGHIKPSGLERLGITVRNLLGEGGLQYNAALDIGGSSQVSSDPITFGVAGSEGGGGLFEDTGLFDEGEAAGDGALGEGEATAEWLEIRVTTPGEAPVRARRTVFDRIPPDVRFTGQPDSGPSIDLAPIVDRVASVELVDLDGNGETDFPPLLGIEAFAIATSATQGANLVTRASRSDESLLATMALAHHYLRDVLGSELLAARDLRLIIDRPAITSVSMDIEPAAPDALVRLGLDIWHRAPGTLALQGSPHDATPPGVVAGVLSQVSERTATRFGSAEPGLVAVPSVGVGSVFEAATEAGIPIVALRDEVAQDAGYGPRSSALIADALAAGDIVVAPATPVPLGGRDRLGFWRIDPTSGTTIDVMDDGSGSESVEYTLPLTRSFKIASCLFALSGSILAGIVEILDLGGLNTAKHGVSIAAIIFQAFSAARGWTGTCK